MGDIYVTIKVTYTAFQDGQTNIKCAVLQFANQTVQKIMANALILMSAPVILDGRYLDSTHIYDIFYE
jgi:hypothetical protein